MNIAIRYYSKGGNTRKLAEAIGKALGVPAESTEKGLAQPVDLLFVGSAVYAGSINAECKAFLDSLTPEQVRAVAVFSTAAGNKTAHAQIKELLAAKGIRVLDEYFHCRAQFLMVNRGHPNDEDCEKAAQFAKKIAKEAK